MSAKPRGRGMIIFLQPGLTTAQRRAALGRVRSIGRMGYGPPVSAVGMAVAVSADKFRTTMRNGVAAMRGHPVLLLPSMFLLACATVLVVPTFAPVTAHQHERAVSDSFVLPGQTPVHHDGAGPGSAGNSGSSGRQQGGLAPSPRAGESPAPSTTLVRPRTRPSPRPTEAPAAQPTPVPGGGWGGHLRQGEPVS